MATKNASGHQGEVKDPEHDGRLKGHKGGEAAKAHAEGAHKDEKDHAPAKGAKAQAEGHGKKDDAKADHAKAEHGKKDEAKKDDGKAKGHEAPKAAEAKGSEEDADLKAREYTDAQGNVHHHTKAYMESHKNG